MAEARWRFGRVAGMLPGCPRCGRMVVFAYHSPFSPGYNIYGCRRCGNVVYGRSIYAGRLTR